MEPPAEENAKLKEAMKLMEKNIQRAQRERDLAESNARDLEYQKGALSEQMATMFEQLRGSFEQLERSSKQLRSLSEQKKVPRIGELFLYCRTALMLLTIVTFVEQDAELCQLHQVIS